LIISDTVVQTAVTKWWVLQLRRSLAVLS